MFHLFKRIYLEDISNKSDKHAYYIADETQANDYVTKDNASGFLLMDVFDDDEQFFEFGFTELMLRLSKADDTKRIIYVRPEQYLRLAAKWIRTVFPEATTRQVAQLVNVATVQLSLEGAVLPEPKDLGRKIFEWSEVAVDDDLHLVVEAVRPHLSLEFLLLDYLAGNHDSPISEPIRLFVLRSSQHLIIEAQRDLRTLFFTQYAQHKYGYTASEAFGDYELLPQITSLNLLTKTNLPLMLERLKVSERTQLLKDLEKYFADRQDGQSPHYRIEKLKLEIVSKVEPLDNVGVAERFFEILRSSTEHTDHLEWNDAEKVNLHLIHYTASLPEEAWQGYRI